MSDEKPSQTFDSTAERSQIQQKKVAEKLSKETQPSESNANVMKKLSPPAESKIPESTSGLPAQYHSMGALFKQAETPSKCSADSMMQACAFFDKVNE